LKCYYVYILASKKNGAFYVGVTNDLRRRLLEHKDGSVEGFTKKYHIGKLVYFERHNNINRAIQREKDIKAWQRQWKVNLIEESNSEWLDLSEELFLGEGH
jgi:putative endonuclease